MTELKNYAITVRITDRNKKPAHLEGEETEERVSWTDEIEANKFADEETARIAIMMHYENKYDSRDYKLEIIACRETLIIPEKKLILPN